ncbi:MAG: ATP-dependent DNA helicase [Nevskiaceae bacterium]|nr:MAG: ATP-dependent DNA helicase [Nevskiaceae bacterium]TBR74890.1 MAG: ATP-dependent DNA helicase [Nevskiaceae bacterium]
MPGFVPRNSQQAMAQAVEHAFAAREKLLVEAGTGTGKTYAYLVPALQSGLRVAISTGTRNLQDQLFHRDLPRVREVLASGARVALLKGRSNYLCLHRLERALQTPAHRRHYKTLADLRRWSRITVSGEIADHGSHDPAVLAAATSTAENCLGNKCPEFDQCFVVKARRAAQAADLVVVNHHLLLSDFRLREEGFGVLPGVDAVVVDEAHQLPELAPQFFGERVSTRQLQDLARDTMEECTTLGDLPELSDLGMELAQATAPLAVELARQQGRIADVAFRHNNKEIRKLENKIKVSVEELTLALDAISERNPELAHLSKRCARLRDAYVTLVAPEAPAGWVRWVEGGKAGGSWHGAPVETAASFQRLFAAYPGSWVFTSATLSGASHFTDFREAIGTPGAQALALDSPFDYARQARLYLPPDLPDPADPDYLLHVVRALQPLIAAAQGGAMILCTSHRAVSRIAELLRTRVAGQAAPLPCTVLVQGEASKAALVAQFAQDGNAILVATASFWEGVDIKGRALRLLAIDKLPFQAQGDPIFEARLAALKAAGRRPFVDYQLPHMIISLRQGVGRLIRDEQDYGLVVICDPRMSTRNYGKRVRASLPPMPVLHDSEQACAWLRNLPQSEAS